MNWRNIAIEDLRNHAAYRTALTTIKEDITRLETENINLKSTLAGSGEIRGKGKKDSDRQLSNIVMIDKLKKQLNETEYIINRVERGLNVLTNDELIALEYRYIYQQNNAIDRICECTNYVRSSVYNLINRALERFTKAMYGA